MWGNTKNQSLVNFDELVALSRELDQHYKFRLPDHDVELDIRDYELREVYGSYVLTHKNAPEFDPMAGRTTFRFAQYIYLQGCTQDFARQLVTAFPHLDKKGQLPCSINSNSVSGSGSQSDSTSKS